MNSLRWGVLLCAANLLACNSNIPKKDSLLGSVQALQAGVYDSRLQSRQQRLVQLQRQHGQQRKQFNELKHKTTIEARRMQLLRDAVRQEQLRKSRHAANIKMLNIRRHKLKRELLILEKSIRVMDRQYSKEAKGSQKNAASIGQLTKERDKLRRQLQLLIKKGI